MTDAISNLIGNIASTYATDTIFILGKGPSIDQIDPQIFAGSLVIAMNDAERIAPADISLFHAAWAADSVQANGLKSRAYLTSTPLKAADRSVVQLPHTPLTQESADLMMQRFQAGDLVIEDILFITALQVARKVAAVRGRPQTVYMVGLDFSYDGSQAYSERIDSDFSHARDADRKMVFNTQEFYFLNALYVLKGSEIEVRHVGTKSFSALSPTELNAQLGTPEPLAASDNIHKVDVIAELTTNHFGDRLRLERMIRSAKAAGADYIKLQKRDVESFYSAEQLKAPYVSPFGSTFGDYRHQLELSKYDFVFVDTLCKSLGMGWFASILDKPSFEFMLDVKPAMVKLPSTISEHTDYLEYVSKNYTGSVVLSTGMTDEAYERWVLDNFTACEKLILMQANSAYPTPAEDTNIAVVRRYHELSAQNPRIVPAFSSHDFGWLGSALAVAAGARMVEKHVKLGNTEWAHFDAVAVDLTTPAFKEYVDQIRLTERMVGSGEKRVNKSEHHKYRVAQA
ncbi:N-acetylneuraminate synthase family protein [Asticcacaulis sp. SL142]|uniref:N-acetylneuraminate synthase family protein n=1 Tax=Asticcacaulis sp. SL142 TaxID=2995155 RepID=UPI00226CDDD1|nr:N-acetylneuraminate synthase family protein [Asticcacaulis sp. SL142]WAC47005.1 N-acetylneuraminate synthase family protein [Asticcacaulis sp. SL142]